MGEGSRISRVVPGSIASHLGISPGDRILAVDGEEVRDALDFTYRMATDLAELQVVNASGDIQHHRVVKDPDEDLGIEFTDPLFGGGKRCQNRCLFCFVDMLPRGLRAELYVKDDDYRLSFLHGNFITLTNLDAGQVDRIAGQGLSPLYVSVHATDPGVRERIMGNPRAGQIMKDLSDLVGRGIKIHAQVVLCPGVNDGDVLEKTVEDLGSLWPGVASVGIVPVGIGKNASPDLKEVGREMSRSLVNWAREKQRRFSSHLEDPFVFLADEIYIRAGAPIPPVEHYGDFPQLENGVGIAALFIDSLNRIWRIPGEVERRKITLVTGIAAEGILRQGIRRFRRVKGLDIQVVAVPNRLFGPGVTVAGLLSGGDILKALEGRPLGDRVLVPSVTLRSQGDLFLDDMSPGDVSRTLGVPVEIVEASGQALARVLLGGVKDNAPRRYRRKA